MKRREFITLLGGATAAWPLGAHAQQPERMRRIGALMGWSDNDPVNRSYFAVAQLGWVEGRNLVIDVRWARGSVDRARAFAKANNVVASSDLRFIHSTSIA